MVQTEIRIENARSHNLRGVSCRIPLRALTVITGVSGSGKSTLAFDTLYAEGQRRYVTSLSTYARQFLERLPRPEVDGISNLPPAIAIEQRNRVTNARSTVATATEIHDHLRLLFSRIGESRCPDCDRPVEPGTVTAVADRMLERWAGERIAVGAPLVIPTERDGEDAEAFRDRLARDGFTRLLDAKGKVVDVTELDAHALAKHRSESLLLIDRLALRADDDRARLTEAVASAFSRGAGELFVLDASGERSRFREGLACDGCGRVLPAPTPALFSFNSPLGACETCQGFGRVPVLDLDRVIPDPARSLDEDAIAPFSTPSGREMQGDLVRTCRRLGIPTDVPWRNLDDAQRAIVIEGDGDAWYGVRGFFEWLEGRRYKVQARVQIARYRRFDVCPACAGARLRAEALCVRVAGRHLGELAQLTIGELRTWLAGLELSGAERARCGRLMELLLARVGTVDRVGLGYLALDRQVRTLSGGEAQRIQLATALGGSLTAALYVLDEPSIGLHARDVDRLLEVLRTIRNHGNTVVVVEHAPEIVGAADHVIDLGPGAGSLGGQLVVEGSVQDVRDHPESLTGRALRGERLGPRRSRERRRVERGQLRVVGATQNNLQNVDVEIPLGRLVAVTGVSGAGKSTLVRSVLVGNLRPRDASAAREARMPERGACKEIIGRERVSAVVVVDQSPAARSPRSNPVTVSKAFDGIRRRFANTRTARALGMGPGWFSFNVPGGRCDACEGAGEVVIDMHFLDDVRVPCDRCNGLRYKREVLDVELDGRTIVDVLSMTIDDAVRDFAGDAKIAGRLEPFARVGLGYLTLGQPLSTLSGGEHQRVRLGLALADRDPGALYVLDEPTTGLHPADVKVLLDCLEELIGVGGSVIVVEHNLDVIRQADYVIDMGPGGGPEGGRVVAYGTPEEVAAAPGSHTGEALRAG